MKNLKQEFLNYYKDYENEVFMIIKDVFHNNDYAINFQYNKKGNEVKYYYFRIYFMDINDNFELINKNEREIYYFNLLLPFIEKLKLNIKLKDKLPLKNKIDKKGKI